MTDFRFIEAKFATQEQAESVVRKLTALRGNRFRIERVQPPGAAAHPSSAHAEFADEAGIGMTSADAGTDLPFSLSVQIPAMAVEQAISVIRAANGYVR
jgi:hypothetical protein